MYRHRAHFNYIFNQQKPQECFALVFTGYMVLFMFIEK